MRKFFISAIGVIAIGLVILVAGINLIDDRSFVFEEGAESRVLSEFQESNERLSVVLEIIGKEKRVNFTTKFIEGESVHEFLVRYKEENENFTFEYEEFEGIGPYVTSFMGEDADPDREFWKFEIDGEESQVGIGDYKLVEGNLITFTLVNF
jgi:hypothetical protein